MREEDTGKTQEQIIEEVRKQVDDLENRVKKLEKRGAK